MGTGISALQCNTLLLSVTWRQWSLASVNAYILEDKWEENSLLLPGVENREISAFYLLLVKMQICIMQYRYPMVSLLKIYIIIGVLRNQERKQNSQGVNYPKAN